MTVSPDSDPVYTVRGTTNYIEQGLANRDFDNTIIYFCVCNAAADERLLRLFEQHGAAAFIGTEGSFNIGYSGILLEQFVDVLGGNRELTDVSECRGISDATLVDTMYGMEEQFKDMFFQYFGDVLGDESAQSLQENQDEIRIGDGTTFRELSDTYWDHVSNMASEGYARLYVFHDPQFSMTGAAQFTGRAHTSRNDPVRDVEVTLYRWLNHRFVQEGHALTDRDGAYDMGFVPFGQYVLHARLGAQEAIMDFEFSPENVQVPDIIMESSFSGIVLDAEDGQPIAEAYVQVDSAAFGMFTREDGRFEVINPEPGIYTITVTMQGYEDSDPITFEIGPGEVVVLPELLLERVQLPEFEGVGNDPNNLYQSDYCLAFDEEHVYFNNMESGITQLDLDGANPRVYPTTMCNPESVKHLNCYDGKLYYSGRSGVEGGWNDMLVCMDLSTGEETLLECLFASDSSSEYHLFMVEGLLFSAYTDGSGFTSVQCWDSSEELWGIYDAMLDMEVHVINLLYMEEYADINFTVAGETVYAILTGPGGPALYAIDLNELRSGNGSATFVPVEEGFDFGAYAEASVIFDPDGLLLMREDPASGGQAVHYTHVQLQATESDDANGGFDFNAGGEELEPELRSIGEENFSRIYSDAHRFVIGNDFLLIEQTDDNRARLCAYPGMNFANGFPLMDANVCASMESGSPNLFFGRHDGTLYMIENGTNNLIAVSGADVRGAQ